jgi:hypothetical protein
MLQCHLVGLGFVELLLFLRRIANFPLIFKSNTSIIPLILTRLMPLSSPVPCQIALFLKEHTTLNVLSL